MKDNEEAARLRRREQYLLQREAVLQDSLLRIRAARGDVLGALLRLSVGSPRIITAGIIRFPRRRGPRR
jgi:hypothetical protein